MTSLAQRQTLLTMIDEAVAAGARTARVCQIVGLSLRTVQRWKRTPCCRSIQGLFARAHRSGPATLDSGRRIAAGDSRTWLSGRGHSAEGHHPLHKSMNAPILP